MKKTLLVLCGVFSLSWASGQLIANGGFETYTTPLPYNSNTIENATGWYDGCAWGNINGTLGTPDLITNDPSVGVYAKIPLVGHIAARSNGFTNNAFAALGGTHPTATYPELYGESILAALTENLTEDYVYTFSAWTAAWFLPASYGFPVPEFQMEVVLRKPNNCTDGKLVFTSGNVPVLNRGADGVVTSNWSNITGTFVLDAADVAQGYSLLEIRFNNGTAQRVGIDDVSLTKAPRPKAAFSFVNIGQSYTTAYSNQWGNVPITQMCAAPAPAETQVLINGGASSNEQGYRLTVQEWDVLNWVPVGGPMYNQWITPYTTVPTTDINLSNLPGVTIQPGKIYAVTVGVGNVVHEVTHWIRINPLPAIDVPATATICNGDATSVAVTSNTWPVKVYRGSTLVGTYSSSPISLSPTTTTTYTFTATSQYGCSTSDQIAITVNNCPRASFVFKDVFTVVNEGPTQYGYVPVSQLCAPDVYIDGSASTYETSYWLDVETMNISNWTMGPYLYSGWTTGQVGSNINLLTLIRQNNPSFNFQVGQIYNIGIAVAPGNHSVNQLFRVVNCAKSLGGMNLEEVSSDAVRPSAMVFPNPSTGTFKVTFDQLTTGHVVVMNLLGEEVYNSEVSEETASLSIDLSDRPAGVYMLHVKQQNGETIQQKIIKN